MGHTLSCFQSPYHKNKKKYSNKYQIPTTQQASLWCKELGITNQSKYIQFDYSQSKVVHHSFNQIQKDLNRTFPESQFLKQPQNRQIFHKVLKKFTVYFPKTGYTQGINFIAGYLLLGGFSETQSFTILCKICTHHNLMGLGLYQDQFPLNRVYCALFWEILSDRKPKLAHKIKQFNLPDQLWIFQWFMTFFIYSFPLEIVKQLLTYAFQHKGMSVVMIAITITMQLQQQIFKCDQQYQLLQIFEQLKSMKYWQKSLRIKNIMNQLVKEEDFLEKDMKQYLGKISLNIKNNYYLQYFKLSDNDRKIKNMQYLNTLSEERKNFLANPSPHKYIRNISDISMIDSLESISYRKMYQSLFQNYGGKVDTFQLHNQNNVINNWDKSCVVNGNINHQWQSSSGEMSTRMWASDLMQLDVKAEQSTKNYNK